MTSYFSAEGNIVNYPPGTSPAIQCHDPSQLAAHQNMLGTPQYPDVIAFWHNSQQPQMSPPIQNQMASSIPDQKKHKRTRSGCFTCRARRVKCDETHPVCDRCSKGNRECVYPTQPMRRAGSRANLKNNEKHPPIPESDSSDENQANEDGALGVNLPGSDEGPKEGQPNRRLISTSRSSKGTVSRRQSTQSLAKRKASRRPSESRSSTKETSGSPLSDTTGMTSDSHGSFGNFENIPPHLEPSLQVLSNLPGTARLKPDVRFFLAYRHQNVTFRHYFLKACAESFVRDDMVVQALEYPPLLYAVVGFAAYHYAVGQPNGKITTFLQYYNQSVSALLKSLRASERHCDAMLLTILQLAAFEEYLGDWVNLVDHHQAAHRMLLELYNPETIQQDNFRRHIFMWYSRFDVMAGLLAGNETILNREWYTLAEKKAVEDANRNPDDLNRQLMKWGALNRTFAMDMASLFARTQRGLVSMDEFMTENQKLEMTLDELRQQVDSMMDPKYIVTSYPNRVPLCSDDIVDPYVPGTVCEGSHWEANYCAIDLLGSKLMHRYQTSLVQQQTNFSDLTDLALEICRLIETMCRWPGRPKDFAIVLQSTMGISSLFLPHDEKHIMWSRRKMAMIEQLGYIYPITLRTRMANLWKIPEVHDWWLPNNEGYPTLIREIREWTKERTTNPRDTFREALRDMKMMFWRMNVDDGSSQTTSPGSQSAGYPERTPEQTPP